MTGASDFMLTVHSMPIVQKCMLAMSKADDVASPFNRKRELLQNITRNFFSGQPAWTAFGFGHNRRAVGLANLIGPCWCRTASLLIPQMTSASPGLVQLPPSPKEVNQVLQGQPQPLLRPGMHERI